ncbi:predicted protein [Chaetomium globosum CBS 148.51]|uniref:Uncharacterized protein n=1 Tax=Chaetomium globosum (strain ATCC 6205 / CBS 148.51 / DSM 1962 / NBRC 6347 / NRRL 1970) TaxID=306901 RepID=Q2GQV5_CHAGB|nr:uncharacterized protein CHGG_09649 [Chaetomium globosum CBS 148.51]EAQ83245.1 predicted protein [Chaetomium globosum CBS 148.51]
MDHGYKLRLRFPRALLSYRRSREQWTVPPLPVKVIRNYETWDLTGISFTMSRPISPSKVEGLDIEINCQTHPSGERRTVLESQQLRIDCTKVIGCQKVMKERQPVH